ncbi:MAG TPA: ferritin-like domain-containing protein [Longimicrobiaceae bacterium]|nr:ferritin-like domain-containing protein [Longimicrobiaceae bacterium]
MSDPGVRPVLIDLLERARAAEKEQALWYRSLASRAEELSPDLAQRFHDLHADEQHHLSRITARVLELGERPKDLAAVRAPAVDLDEWEPGVREREGEEIARYRRLLDEPLDEVTRALIEAILAVEEHHAAELGGKWTMA